MEVVALVICVRTFTMRRQSRGGGGPSAAAPTVQKSNPAHLHLFNLEGVTVGIITRPLGRVIMHLC